MRIDVALPRKPPEINEFYSDLLEFKELSNLNSVFCTVRRCLWRRVVIVLRLLKHVMQHSNGVLLVSQM